MVIYLDELELSLMTQSELEAYLEQVHAASVNDPDYNDGDDYRHFGSRTYQALYVAERYCNHRLAHDPDNYSCSICGRVLWEKFG